MDYFTSYKITSQDFFAGMREAIIKYAVWHNGEQYAGCHTLKNALEEVDRLELEWHKQKANQCSKNSE